MTIPYSSLRFIVRLASGVRMGGFAEVSGLHLTRPGAVAHSVNISLKQGRINAAALFEWIRAARAADPSGKRPITITQLDADRKPTESWSLTGTFPITYTGPTLSAESGGEVEMEELVLSAESIEHAV